MMNLSKGVKYKGFKVPIEETITFQEILTLGFNIFAIIVLYYRSLKLDES
jgi:hypothetical protein